MSDLTTYRGPVNEDGLEWHGDLEQYITNDMINLMRANSETGEVWHVLVGIGNVKVSEGEWKKARDQFGDDKKALAEYLLKHHYNPMRAETVVKEAIRDYGSMHEWDLAMKIVGELGKRGYTLTYNEEDDTFRGK